MKKIIIILYCIFITQYSFAADQKILSGSKPTVNEAPAGFWGLFSKTPDPGTLPAGGSALADTLHINPAEINMQPAEPNGAERFPADWQAAIQLAVNHHPAISSSIATLESSAFTMDGARAGYLPAIKAGVTSGRQQENSNGHIATVGLSQMLYDFGKTGSLVDQASAKYLRQQATVLIQIDTIIEQTALALNEVYRSTQLLDNAKKQVKALRDILALTQLRADAGASTRVDPVQAQARVEAAQAEQLDLEIKLQQQKYHLQSLMGQPVAGQNISAPVSLLPLIERQHARIDLNRNPTILVAQAEAAVALAELRNYKAQRYPTVSLEANTNKYIGDIADYQRHSQYQNVYLSVNSTLYQGGALVAQESASARALEAARTTIASKKLEISDQQRHYFQSVKGLQKNISLLMRRMKTIVETRSLYREQYLSLGNRNVLDLLNAEQEISRAQQDLINARCDLWASSVNYLVVTGMARETFNLNNQVIQGLRIAP